MAKGALITCLDSIGGKNVEGTDATAETGELEVDVRGLLAGSPYTITWSKVGFGALPQFNNMKHVTGLDVGEYTVKLSYNDNRSSRTRTLRITAPDAFSIANISVTSPSCSDPDPKGTIKVTPAYSGSGTLEYNVLQTSDENRNPVDDPYDVTNETGEFADCPVGEYLITVRIKDTDVELSQTASVLEEVDTPFAIAISNIDGYDCNRINTPDETGSFIATVDEPQEWYALVDAVSGATRVRGRTDNSSLVYTFDDVLPGIYQVWTGINACMEKSDPIILTEPAAVILNSVTPVSETCSGDNDGSITIDASGGALGLEYSLYEADENGDQGSLSKGPQTDNYFDNLAPGNYIVAVTDGNGCSAEIPTTIAQGYRVAVALAANSLRDACAEKDNGQFSVNATGGPSTAYSFYLYPWGGTAGSTPTNATGIFTGLTPTGEGYDVKAVDQVYGCSATLDQAVMIARLSAVTFQSAMTPVLCKGGSSGTITVTAIGGGTGQGYSAKLEEFPTLQPVADGANFVFESLPAGTYTVTVSDNNGCSSTSLPVAVTEPSEAVSIGTATVGNITCFGGNNGSITIAATGGTGTITYTLFDEGDRQIGSNTNGSFTGLIAGTYYVVSTDANGCLATRSSIAVIQPNQIAVTVARVVPVSCYGGSDGSIRINAADGVAPYSYSISKADGSGVQSYQADNLYAGLVAGTYVVTVKDGNGCEQASEDITVTEPPLLTLSASQTKLVTCEPGNDGAITATAGGGVGNYQYKTDATSYIAGNVITGLAAGDYVVTIKDGNNCELSTTGTINVRVANAPVVTATGSDIQCFGKTGSITSSATAETDLDGTAGSISYYQLYMNGVPYSEKGQTTTFDNLTAGSYAVHVKDNYGCENQASTTVAGPSAVLSITLKSFAQPYSSTKGSITVTATGGWEGYTIVCNLIVNTSSTTLYTLTDKPAGDYTFDNLNAGQYQITIVDKEGCTVSPVVWDLGLATSELDPEAPSLKILPNPSSDGHFIIEWDTMEDRKVTLEIYTTNGQLVYKTNVQTGAGGARTSLDISRQGRGAYLLRVPELDIKKKLVVQ